MTSSTGPETTTLVPRLVLAVHADSDDIRELRRRVDLNSSGCDNSSHLDLGHDGLNQFGIGS